MRLLPALPFASLLLLAGLAQGAEQGYPVGPFTSIDNTGPFSVTVDVGPAASVKAVGDARVLALLKVEVVGGQLRLSLKEVNFHGNKDDTHVTITLPQLSAFTMHGAGAIDLHHVAGDSLELSFSGAGSLKADGAVKRLQLDLAGVGELDTSALVAETAKVEVSGVGSVRVRATARLQGNVSGVGSLTYFGHPKELDTHASGLGHVTRGD